MVPFVVFTFCCLQSRYTVRTMISTPHAAVFHPDFTVGHGITPCQSLVKGSRGLYRRSGIDQKAISPRPENCILHIIYTRMCESASPGVKKIRELMRRHGRSGAPDRGSGILFRRKRKPPACMHAGGAPLRPCRRAVALQFIFCRYAV